MTPSESRPDNTSPLVAARARARAVERTTELRFGGTRWKSTVRLALVGLVCAAAGFGIGVLVTDDAPMKSAKSPVGVGPPSSQLDPSTFPAGASEPTTTTSTDDPR